MRTTLASLILLLSGLHGVAQDSDVSLTTIPRQVYKTADRLDTKEKNECWYFRVVVQDRSSRELKPTSVVITLYSGPTVMKIEELRGAALSGQTSVSFTKNAGLEETFDLGHHFCEPAVSAIDRLRYELEVEAPDDKKLKRSIEVPLLSYVQKSKLIFPIKGNFVVVNGNVIEGGHHEWSQQFAYDIVGLDAHGAVITGEGAKNEDFLGWGREVIAPADGVVTYSRNDIPDNSGPGVIDMEALQALPEQPWPIGGNAVVIDHGGREYSFLGHMQKGSVRVKRGDHVRQADVLGLLGNSGHAQGPHLHYHLMNGDVLFQSDGLPSRFENVEGGTPTQGTMLDAK
jgi:hypothetical protein